MVNGDKKYTGRNIFQSNVTFEKMSPVNAETMRSSCSWREDDMKKLKDLMEYDLTKRALLKSFPTMATKTVASKVFSLNSNAPWTYGELLLLVKMLSNQVDFLSVPFRDEFPCRKVEQLIRKKQLYCKYLDDWKSLFEKEGWDIEDTLRLFVLKDVDLSSRTLRRELPKISIEEIRRILSQLKFKTSFTRSETNLLRELLSEGSYQEILNEYPLKSLEALKKKIVTLRNTKSLRSTIDKMLQTIENENARRMSELNSQFDIKTMIYFVKFDLTRTTLEKNFPGIPIEYLKKIALDWGLLKKATLTQGERTYILECIQNGIDKKDMEYNLPFRTRDSIDYEISIIAPWKRRKTFKSKLDELIYMAEWYQTDKFSSSKPDAQMDRGNEARTQTDLLSTRRSRMNGLENRNIKSKEKGKVAREGNQKAIELRKGDHATKTNTNTGKQRNTKATGNNFEEKKPTSFSRENQFTKTKDSSAAESTFKKGSTFTENLGKQDIDDILKSKNKTARRKTTATNIRNITSISESGAHDKNVFFPEDVFDDAYISLDRRRLFEPDMIRTGLFLKSQEEASDMFDEGEGITPCDTIAADIVSQYHRSYRDLPIGFPSLMVRDHSGEKMIINPINKIYIRYLLHPWHTEMFILAQPKSDELDPVNEIKKLIQIHFALYFAHSTPIKQIIYNDYCKAIDESLTNNDFNEFMFIIDKWNSLMIALTPNKSQTEKDINEEIRSYFAAEEIRYPTIEDLKLPTFFSEITGRRKDYMASIEFAEPESPLFEPIIFPNGNKDYLLTSLGGEANSVNNHKDKGNSPITYVGNGDRKCGFRYYLLQLPDYEVKFNQRLSKKKKVSRYALQQIILRVYSRVVSTNSRKLRSYRAFTAEVYGELLPSFISEVLTKVRLKPGQKFYDLGSGVGNAVFQAALEFGAISGGCELMEHASNLTFLQQILLRKHLRLFGVKDIILKFALNQSFVKNEIVKREILDCDVVLVNNFLFDANLNVEVGKLLYGLKPGTVIISLNNLVRPRYKVSAEPSLFDYLKVEKHEMKNFSVSWTANKVPYYISTVQETICPEYL